MFAPYYRLKLIRGDTLDIAFRITGRLGNTVLPVNLEGSYLEFRLGWLDGEIGKATDTSGLTITDAADGIVSLHIPHTETALIPIDPDAATFSLRRLSAGVWTTVLYGDVEVMGEAVAPPADETDGFLTLDFVTAGNPALLFL